MGDSLLYAREGLIKGDNGHKGHKEHEGHKGHKGIRVGHQLLPTLAGGRGVT